jgi:hypothetical protein
MSDLRETSTNIMDLPTDPEGNKGLNLDQSTISQIVSGLQQATLAGATQLPSRDIPMTTSGHNTDPQIQPNYVPSPPPNADYIKNVDQTADMINEYNKKTQSNDSLDDLYNEIQTPILLAIIYFLFQLPFVRKNLFKYLPLLFSTDGNLNINGFLFTSVLYGLIYYILNKIMVRFSAF